MKIVNPNGKNWEEKIGYSKKILLDEKDLFNDGSLVQLIKIKPDEVAKAHHHKIQTEIFYFLSDNGYWIINGQEYHFKTGEILAIEPGDVHEVRNDSESDYMYICFKIKYDSDDFYWN